MSTPRGEGQSAAPATLRLRNAVCERCGYHASGVEMRNGLFVCPECGAANTVLNRPRPEPGRAHVYLWRVVRLGLVAGTAMVLLVLLRR
ncbi:MAG: hypothetical protein JNJ48_01130 [Phycisphaerae bacterium]|nr:hypothetical protein [Phycisphaerae bacterium]